MARVDDLELVVPDGTTYSFFNSPYPAHRACSAVDVYFEDEGLMPVESGRVLEVRRLRAGRLVEHLVLVEVGEGVVLKVLHVEPRVRVGERLSLWDPIGRLTTSSFFFPWTDPHAHFEVRPRYDPYRVRGALKLDLTPTLRRVGRPEKLVEEFEVVDTSSRYV